MSARFIDASMHRDTCHAIRIAIQFASIAILKKKKKLHTIPFSNARPKSRGSPGSRFNPFQPAYLWTDYQTDSFNFLQCYMLCFYCCLDQRKETMVHHLSQTEKGELNQYGTVYFSN